MASLLTQIKVRKDTYANLDNMDTPLAAGEPGFAYDTGDYAVGDGSSKFSQICFKLKNGIINNGTSTDNAIARFDGTTGRIIQDSTATISDKGHLSINTTSDPTMTVPAVNILHTGPATGSAYADLMVLSGFNQAPYGFKFRTYGDGTAIIQSQRINNNSETFALSLNPNGGNVLVGGNLIQGTKNTDSSIANMNQFTSDLYVKGDGSAPNSPKVAGFYLGKSAGTDENRHMDIVTGSTVSYIDFNRAGTVRDYDVRLRVNNSTGDVHFQWDSGYTAAQKLLKADSATIEAAKFVKTDGADTHILLAGGGTKAVSDFTTGGGSISDYVTLNTAQTISGVKTFSAQPVISAATGLKFTNGNCTLRIYNTSASPTDYAAIEVRSNVATTNRNLFLDLDNNSLVVGAASGTPDTTYKVNVKGTFNATTIYENGTALSSKYQAADADLTAIAGLTGTSGFLKKTAADTWALDTTVITGSGTSGYIAKFNGTNSVTNGPAFGSDTTKYLRNDGTWVKPPNDNTEYGADRGISLEDNKFGHSNTAVTEVTTAGLYKIKYDAYGHITGTESFSLPTVNNGKLTMAVSGTGLSLGSTKTFTANQSSNATITYTLDSNAEGNRTANQVVIAKADGRINSEQVAITSSGTEKVTMQYDTSYKALKFVFA